MNNVNRKDAVKFTAVEYLQLMRLLRRIVAIDSAYANNTVKDLLKAGEAYSIAFKK